MICGEIFRCLDLLKFEKMVDNLLLFANVLIFPIRETRIFYLFSLFFQESGCCDLCPVSIQQREPHSFKLIPRSILYVNSP